MNKIDMQSKSNSFFLIHNFSFFFVIFFFQLTQIILNKVYCSIALDSNIFVKKKHF